MAIESLSELPYTDDPAVREIYADDARMTSFFAQAVRIELVVVRSEVIGPNKSEYRLVPSAKLVLAPQAAFALHGQLSKLIRRLEETGIVRRLSEMPRMKQ